MNEGVSRAVLPLKAPVKGLPVPLQILEAFFVPHFVAVPLYLFPVLSHRISFCVVLPLFFS